jgi:hypothetical protein
VPTHSRAVGYPAVELDYGPDYRSANYNMMIKNQTYYYLNIWSPPLALPDPRVWDILGKKLF